jgi:hypothetical protein
MYALMAHWVGGWRDRCTHRGSGRSTHLIGGWVGLIFNLDVLEK